MFMMDNFKKDKDSEILAKQLQSEELQRELNEVQKMMEERNQIEEDMNNEKNQFSAKIENLQRENESLTLTLNEQIKEMDQLKGVLNIVSVLKRFFKGNDQFCFLSFQTMITNQKGLRPRLQRCICLS